MYLSFFADVEGSQIYHRLIVGGALKLSCAAAKTQNRKGSDGKSQVTGLREPSDTQLTPN